ncbi:MAG: phosphate signaling complex protein PhoU [Cellvibrionaceae bacterium]
MDFTQAKHTSQRFDEDLQAIKSSLMELGGRVEKQVIDAVNALEKADKELAEKVIISDDKVNQREMRLDEDCTKILVKRQPAAGDMRFVVAVMRAAHDLERMGDEAKKIAKMSMKLGEAGEEAPQGYTEIRHIAAGVSRMVNESLDSFARFDAELALTVVEQDQIIDREYTSALRELMTYMMEDPRSIKRVMRILWALRSLERIGDHAQNIAEHVIYIVKGKDVRHSSLEEVNEIVGK